MSLIPIRMLIAFFILNTPPPQPPKATGEESSMGRGEPVALRCSLFQNRQVATRCPKSATARFGCKQRKAGNDIGAALGGAAQRATAGRRSARSEQSSCACPHVRLG